MPDIGTIITIAVIIITAFANYIRNKTRMELEFTNLKALFDEKIGNIVNRLDTMNGNVKGLSEWRIEHLEKCHGKKN